MFPLNVDSYPTSATELIAGLTDSIRALATLAARPDIVTLQGENWRAADALTITLDGGTLRPEARPQHAGTLTDRQPAFATRRLNVSGKGVQLEQARGDLSLTGTNVAFDFARNARGKVELVLAAMDQGRVEAQVGLRDLEAVVLSHAQTGAAAHGAKIEKVEITLTSLGRRSVQMEARVTARKIFAAVVRIVGRLDISDAMVATLSGLKAIGEGMIGGVVVGFLQPKLDQVNGAALPLTAPILGDVRLTDVTIDVSKGLRIEATAGR